MDAGGLRETFEEWGVVRLDRAFDEDSATRIRDAVARYAQRKTGVSLDDPSTWSQRLQLSWKSMRRNPVFDVLVGNDAVTGALDAIFGAGGWLAPKPGAQVLCNLPQPGPWVLPDAWHMDCGFERPSWPVPAVKLFAFFGEVGPQGGGTMVLPGTHRVMDRYRQSLPPGTGGGMRNWRPFVKHDPWLAQLLEGVRRPDGGRSLVGQVHDVGGVPVEVRELTGKPGDVVITHFHVFHSAAPNVSDRPRRMLGKAILTARGSQPVEANAG